MTPNDPIVLVLAGAYEPSERDLDTHAQHLNKKREQAVAQLMKIDSELEQVAELKNSLARANSDEITAEVVAKVCSSMLQGRVLKDSDVPKEMVSKAKFYLAKYGFAG